MVSEPMNDKPTPTPQRVRPTPPASPMADPQPSLPAAESDLQRAGREATPAGMARPRKPFGAHENVLDWPPIPGHQLRWFNDKPGRVERALEAGYSHVQDRHGRNVERTVGVREMGGGQLGFLMKIPDEFFNEDFAKKQESLDATDRTIMRGRLKLDDSDRPYVPKDSIRIGVSRRP